MQTEKEGQVAEYFLPTPDLENAQLCFCEAPGCDQSWRFGQTVSAVLPFAHVKKQCQKMLRWIDTTPAQIERTQIERNHNRGWGSVARVGNKLYGTPWQKNNVLVLDLSTEKVSQIWGPASGLGFSSAVVNDCVYAPPWQPPGHGMLFVINTSSQRVYYITYPGILDGCDHCYYSSIVAVNAVLYVLPKSSVGKFLSIDIGRDPGEVPVFKSVTMPQQINGCPPLPEQDPREGASASNTLWFGAVAVGSSVFASPWNADCMLVYGIGNGSGSFEGIDTSNVATGDHKWSKLIEAGGRLYAAPSHAKQILVVDVNTKKPWGIPITSCDLGSWWTSLAHHGQHIYIVSNTEPYILVHNMADKSVRCLHTQPRRTRWIFMASVVVNDKLYAIPDGEGRALLLDLKPDIVEPAYSNTTSELQ